MFKEDASITFDRYSKTPDRIVNTDSMYMVLAAIGNMLHHLPPHSHDVSVANISIFGSSYISGSAGARRN